MVLQPPQCICKSTNVLRGRFTNAFSLTNDIGLLFRDRISNLGRLLKTFSSIFDMSLYLKSISDRFGSLLKALFSITDIRLLLKTINVRFGSLLKALFSITDIRLLLKSNSTLFKGKYLGILSSPLLLQSTLSPVKHKGLFCFNTRKLDTY